MRRAVVKGLGTYLPERVVTNAELAKKVDTSDEWIVERTGIQQRHIAAEGEFTSHLAIEAARRALADAQMSPDEIDLIILATSTPDNTFPATATAVQAGLGITTGSAFDVQAVCSGFVYALTTANAFIVSGQANNVLVIGAETFSRILDWSDRTTCVLFGDGAGAFVLKAEDYDDDDANAPGIIACRVRSDGRYKEKLYVDGGPSSTKTVGYLRMEGREVFKHAVTNIASVMQDTLDESGFTADDIDLFVPHQANVRILEGTAKKIGLDLDKVIITIAQHGNTSAASVPLAMGVAAEQNRLNKGDLILLEAMGGGFTWGAVLLRW